MSLVVTEDVRSRYIAGVRQVLHDTLLYHDSLSVNCGVVELGMFRGVLNVVGFGGGGGVYFERIGGLGWGVELVVGGVKVGVGKGVYLGVDWYGDWGDIEDVLSTTLEETYQNWLSRISKPSPRTNEFGDWVKLSDPKQALRGRHPMLIRSYIMMSQIFEASRARGFCPSITSASNPQLHLGNPIS
ncbi:hypothetical protein Tco_1293031 [Tanacetum coccineum]